MIKSAASDSEVDTALIYYWCKKKHKARTMWVRQIFLLRERLGISSSSSSSFRRYGKVLQLLWNE